MKNTKIQIPPRFASSHFAPEPQREYGAHDKASEELIQTHTENNPRPVRKNPPDARATASTPT